MAKMDEFREERRAIREKPFKEQFAYFLEYYGMRTLLIIGCIIALGSIVFTIVTRKDTGLYVAMYNAKDLKMDDAYAAEFLAYAGMDSEEETVDIDDGYYMDIVNWDEQTAASIEKTMVYMASRDVDIILGDKTTIDYYAYGDNFMDVRTFLTEEQITKYEDSFYYVDMAIVEAKKEWQDTLATEYNSDYPDPRKPEDMTSPLPVGVFLGDVKELAISSSYQLYGENHILGVVANTEHPERAALFLDFITR